MGTVETELKTLALSLGAELVGVTSRDLLADGPPSADPRFLLPSAKSVISFAVSLDGDIVMDFISKKNWRSHCDNRKAVAQTLYTIGDALVEQLRSKGFEAVNVDLNNNYRPEEGAADVTEMTAFHPEFSHLITIGRRCLTPIGSTIQCAVSAVASVHLAGKNGLPTVSGLLAQGPPP